MTRLAWIGLALAALGLLASLVPQVTYASASSGEPEGDVIVAWPGWSIQQDLGPLSGTVGTFRIWVSVDPGAFRDFNVNASLIDASSREVLREAVVLVSRRYIPAAHTVTFPGYIARSDQPLMLQVGISESQTRHVIYRLAHPEPGRPNVMLNGVPDSGNGPLAYAHLRNGSGLRAAIDGDLSSRVRVALALALGAASVLTHPRIARTVRRAARAVRSRVARPFAWVAGGLKPGVAPTPATTPSRFQRVLETPWYPWPAVAAPIVHFMASNTLHFDVIDLLAPLAAALMAATVLMGVLCIGLRDWHRAATGCAASVVVFFGYGHVRDALDGRLDERGIFAAAVVAAAFAAILGARRKTRSARFTPFLNLVAAVVLLFPLASLATEIVRTQRQTPTGEPPGVEELAAHLLPSGVPAVTGPRPDIYYIILDAYARSDALHQLYGFDNSDFIRQLEERGFYVSRQSTSNYRRSIHSIPSSLNMAYLDDLGSRTPESKRDLLRLSQAPALAAILQSIGYSYTHLESGSIHTGTSSIADQLISFSPAGTVARMRSDNRPGVSSEQGTSGRSNRFLGSLVQTTLLAPLFGSGRQTDTTPYEWYSASRALRMFEFLSSPTTADQPRFVFAHIVKPHLPATFDQFGNFLVGNDGFDILHDPSVPIPYVGQLIYINKLTIDMIDSILESSAEPPIIVIAADHGYVSESAVQGSLGAEHVHSILSAVHLPHGGEDGIYESMSLVNVFRYILDYYFTLGIGLIEDRRLNLSENHFGEPNP